MANLVNKDFDFQEFKIGKFIWCVKFKPVSGIPLHGRPQGISSGLPQQGAAPSIGSGFLRASHPLQGLPEQRACRRRVRAWCGGTPPRPRWRACGDLLPWQDQDASPSSHPSRLPPHEPGGRRGPRNGSGFRRNGYRPKGPRIFHRNRLCIRRREKCYKLCPDPPRSRIDFTNPFFGTDRASLSRQRKSHSGGTLRLYS